MSEAGKAGGADEVFAAFVVKVCGEALAAGISENACDAALTGIQENTAALERDRSQPEHALTVSDYFSRLVLRSRIERGRELRIAYRAELDRMTEVYGPPGEVLLAIWGIESNYGSAMGTAGVIQSLANLAFADKRRSRFWHEQLLAAVRIVAHGDFQPRDLVGSWAGAMGQTQFMPSTYLEHGVDFDGDGVCDIWRSVPDALASAANYLKYSGWQAAHGWGYEVQLTPAFDFTAADPFSARFWNDWQAAGIEAAGAAVVDPSAAMRLILPAGWQGPAFLATPNFEAILTYNRSTIYALSVGCLADAIAGGSGISASWPEEAPLDRAARMELQEYLSADGFDTNGVDGILGHTSCAAARAYQLRHGLKADGHPGAELLSFMRAKRL